METNILTPKELFQKDIRYTIPPFQRPYVWNQDEQWEPLWNDVRNLAESYLESLEKSGSGVSALDGTRPHFLGAVVVKLVQTATSDFEQREVIDGQQRVTTLQLLLDAVHRISLEFHHNKVAKRVSKLVTNDRDLIGSEPDHVFKLWPTRSDREAFRCAMDSRPSSAAVKGSLLVRGHEFFKLQVRNWVEDRVHNSSQKMEALETAATRLLQMVVIDLSSQDDPNVIFETLNARGTPLEQSDLIKNYVLSNNRDSSLWGNLDENWWREEVRQGRLFRSRVDMLLNYWLAMRTGSDVAPLRVFDMYRRYFEEKNLRCVMSDVKCDLANYRHYEEKQGRNLEEKMFYYRMGVMQAGVITPVLLLLLSDRIKQGTRIRSFHILESFLVRRMVCRYTTKDYNRLILDMASELQNNDLDSADEVVSEFLRRQKAYTRIWPSDQNIIESLESLPLYRLLTRGRLRLVLEGIEYLLRCSTKTEHADVPRNLTIEHLMPQGWKGSWRLPHDDDQEAEESERNKLIHSIGNLTLTTHSLNSSMSNAPWEDKRCELQDHSILLLNRELKDQTRWNEDSIRTRSRRMAKLLSEYWPGPDSVSRT